MTESPSRRPAAVVVPRQAVAPAIETETDDNVRYRSVRVRSESLPPAVMEVVPRNRVQLLFGLPVAALRLEEVVDLAAGAIQNRTRLLVGVLNAAKVVSLGSDAFLRHSLLQSDVLLADGQSIVWASRFLGTPLPARVAGIDLFEALLDLAHRDHRRIYLLGARHDVLDRLLETVAQRWPGAVVVGSRDGYLQQDESFVVASEIAAVGAEMVFLGMPTPMKEIFVSSYGAATGAPVLHGVGGSFDVLAGVTRRAPLLWQHLGMEWAYRLLQEPRRLWRRYLTTNTAFVGLVLRERRRPTAPYERPVSMTGRN